MAGSLLNPAKGGEGRLKRRCSRQRRRAGSKGSPLTIIQILFNEACPEWPTAAAVSLPELPISGLRRGERVTSRAGGKNGKMVKGFFVMSFQFFLFFYL